MKILSKLSESEFFKNLVAKINDIIDNFNELWYNTEHKNAYVSCEQSTGDSTTTPMSQKATTEAIQYSSGILQNKDQVNPDSGECYAYNLDTMKVCQKIRQSTLPMSNTRYYVSGFSMLANTTGEIIRSADDAVGGGTIRLEFYYPGYYPGDSASTDTNTAGAGYSDLIPIDITHASFGEPDVDGVRWAETFELALYFTGNVDSSLMDCAYARIAFFDVSGNRINLTPEQLNTSVYSISLSSHSSSSNTRYCIVPTKNMLSHMNALDQTGDRNYGIQYIFNLAKYSDGTSLWGIDPNGVPVGILAEAQYLGYSLGTESEVVPHYAILLDNHQDVSDSEIWVDTDIGVAFNEDDLSDPTSDYLWLGKTGDYVAGKVYRYNRIKWVLIGDFNGLQVTPASETSLGTLRMWTTIENGKLVLNLSTQPYDDMASEMQEML